MKFSTVLFFFLFIQSNVSGKDSTTFYNLPDSVRAVSFIADVNISSHGKKEVYVGLGLKHVKLLLEKENNKGEISFEFPASAEVIAKGLDVEVEKDELEWKFNWQLNTTYKLMIASAVDSLENFVVFSGYIYLPDLEKWKLIGTCRLKNQKESIINPVAIQSKGNKANIDVVFDNVMVQRINGTWKKLSNESQSLSSPPVPPLFNIDSTGQMEADIKLIESAISMGATNANQNIEGVYYNIIEIGNGNKFTVNDSVTVRYQLRIFGTRDVISGSETETYTFMLKSLIKAWQIAVPLVKAGGKIKLVIPSGLAYSIRTRAAKIPPNSILEFDVEIVDAKSVIQQ